MKMTEFVTPQLRTVLKTYQDTATKSLQGPGLLSLVHPLKKEVVSPDLNDEPLVTLPPMPPEIPQPILSAADTGRGVLYETVLEGKPIGCFLLGGEMRLCIPQILNNVLTNFSLEQINGIFDKQRIFCSQCTPEQLNQFKAAKILPEDVNTSGLITRTNAERLCSALLHRPERRFIQKDALSFRVYHRCFGKCEGICTPELYIPNEPACIECLECRGLFSPQKFVCHVHRQENSTLHWGFDSNNWRAYLHVSYDEEAREEYSKVLDKLRDRQLQDPIGHLNSQRDVCTIKRKADMEDSLLAATCKQEPLDIPLKKAKQIDESYLLDYQYQTMILAQYRHPFAFRPWQLGPKHIPPHMAFAPNLPYLIQEPPILQNPERVVRLSECERFERTFQPNVALAPRKVTSASNSNNTNSDREKQRIYSANIQIKQEQPPSVSPELRVASPINQTSPPPISPEGHSGSNEITSSTSPVPATSHKPSHDTEPIESIDNHRTQSQPLSVLTNGANVTLTTNSELELSTDTDDDDSLIGEPDSSNNSASWDIAVEALKDTKTQEREKVLQIIKTLVNENAQLNLENSKLLHELRRKDEQLAELQHQLQNQQQNQLQQVTIRPVEPSSIMVDIVNRTFRTSDKSDTDVIRMPLKKSMRRSPDGSSVVIMQTNKVRDGDGGDANKHECITRFDASLQNGKMLELVQTVDG
ncbi:ski oncogene [Bradysia coprophila]|uniref:ski oncogene n=1 Tax=Bradysia coprophila TaxID=38358 RepID=UPI00187DC196|nr:ski oncogene [Bradysia coprophila]